MLFSSNIFLFFFLPAFLFTYFFCHIHFRNTIINNLVLLGLSFVFYLWGSAYYFFLLYAAIVINYHLGKLISQSSRPKLFLSLGIFYNLGILFYFKYANFVITQVLQPLFTLINIHFPDLPKQFLPIGISFFTFMSIAYLFDIYRKKYQPANFLNFGLYLSLFPHLVAGPIVRYSDINKELDSRSTSIDYFYNGFVRFVFGLGKKVILANNLGLIADKVFALPNSELTTAIAWVGIACYTLQIYFDFSGYTDMSIGLAKFFGFDFPENFNHPYRATSLTDFWRRWHMTLTSWFRDYVYIPLGGNRLGNTRTYLNILIVFLLTGIWHGAAWTFIIWGIYNGIILVIERLLELKYKLKLQGQIGNIVTLIMVMVGWVLFRSISLNQSGGFLKAMVGLNNVRVEYFQLNYFLNQQTLFYLLLGVVVVFIPFDRVNKFLKKWNNLPLVVVQGAICLLVFMYAILLLSKAQFTPFIYFQF